MLKIDSSCAGADPGFAEGGERAEREPITGLRAEPPAGSRGRAPGGGQGGKAP